MKAGPSTPLALPNPLSPWPASRDLEAPLRLLVFAALASFVAAGWLAMITDSPVGRAALAVLSAIAGAALMAWLGRARLSRRMIRTLAAAIALLAVALGAIVMGLPARLVLPWHWGELIANLTLGLNGLWSADYPYEGSFEWTRLAILIGLPLVLGVAAALAFWPARRAAPLLRGIALVVLVVAYATAATIIPPSSPLVQGVVLLLLVWAWLWLPGRTSREALTGSALILVAAVLALPVATSLDRGSPWVDYRSWGLTSTAVGSTESFVWDQSYGPLVWPRVGQTMLEVKSDGPHYWRTAVLDQFDGSRWLQSDAAANSALQLPESPSDPTRLAPLNPDWIHELTFTIQGFRSDLVVSAGTPLGLPNLEGVTATERGLVLPSDQPLDVGDSYGMRSYIPDPGPAQMRRAPSGYPATLAPDTDITLPGGESVHVPFWGARVGGAADRALDRSAYGGVYRLTRSVTAGASNSYEAVNAIESYLGSHNHYSESAPVRHLALRTFIMGARRGYCQHFSGAMALMLRMVGIPARVAAGFSPGRRTTDGTYVVTDFDAHSWVEAYFNGIGWVSFDPTPPTAPAQSRMSGLGAPVPASPSESAQAAPSGTDANARPKSTDQPGSDMSGSSPGWFPKLILIVVVSTLIGGGGVAVTERLRRQSTGSYVAVDAQLAEVASALERVRSWTTRGTTLLTLERRLLAEVGPRSAVYVAKLRAARYEPGRHGAPALSERGLLRHELTAGLGLRGRLRGLLAIPPGRPAPGACKPPFRPPS